jgi:diguanylate cyclase (GGDEF)-like protein
MDAPTFLMVDPNERFLEKCGDIYRAAGYRMIPALDGRAAKETLQRNLVTGVLANLELPGISGAELCRFVKQQHDPRIPVVLMSTEDADGLSLAETAGADNVLFRPVKRAELLFCARAMIRLGEVLRRPAPAAGTSGATPSSEETTGKVQSGRLSQFEFFKAFLSVEIKRARRYGFPLSVMLTSLDRAEQIEKTHGQRVLRHLLGGLARAIRRSVRDIDIPVTLRDDTILVLMPHTDAEGAAHVAERVRQRIRRSVYREDALVIRPTISIGETTYDKTNDRNFSQVVRRASKAMREAFRKGGDRVVVL